MCVNGLVFYWECKILELSPGINPFPALIKSALVRYQCVCVCSRFQNKIIRNNNFWVELCPLLILLAQTGCLLNLILTSDAN